MEDKRKDEGKTEAAVGWWSGLTGEFKRISWPNRQELAKLTIAAIVTSGIVGAIIVGYDLGLGTAYRELVNLLRR